MCSALFGILLETIFEIPPIFFLSFAVLSLILAGFDNRALLVACAALFGLNASFTGPVAVPDQGRDLIFHGIVVAEDHRDNGVKLSVDLQRVMLEQGPVPLPLGIEVFSRSSRTSLGKSLIFNGVIRPSCSFGGRNRFTGSIIGNDKEANRPLGRILFAARRYIDERFRKNLPAESYDLASSLILGGSSRVGAETRSIFTRAGVWHILFVSGLHVGFLIGFIGFCLILLPLPPRVKFLITALILFLYAGITGFIPTVLRAGLMGFLFGWALIQERNVDGLHVVNLTALILLAASPRIIFDLGAQLSYASIYGIMGILPKLKRSVIDRIRVRRIRALATLMGVSAAAQLGVTPLLIYYFQRIQTLAIFSNLLIVPLSSLITYLLFGMIATDWIGLPLARYSGAVASLLLKLLVAVSRVFAGLPGAAPVVMMPFPVLAVAYLFLSRRLRKAAVWCLAVILLILSFSNLPGTSMLLMEADQARLILPDQSRWLISSREKPDRFDFSEMETFDYLVAPTLSIPPKRGYYELPDEFHYMKIEVGDWVIDIRRGVTFINHGRHWELGDTLPGADEMIYIVVRGGNAGQFSVKKFASPAARCAAEIKVIFLKLRLLAGL